MKNHTRRWFIEKKLTDCQKFLCIGVVLAGLALQGQAVDLIKRYPTDLTKGDTVPDRARAWEFTDADVFRVTPQGIATTPGAGGVSPRNADAAFRRQEARYAEGWYASMVQEIWRS